MRRAKISDYWRGVKEIEKYPFYLVELCQRREGELVSKFAPDGISAIVGVNGAGKSSFFEFLSDRSYDKTPFLAHEASMNNSRIIQIPGGSVDAVFIDPYSELTASNLKLDQFRSTFDQYDLLNIDGDEKALISYVLGMEYESISIEEVETGSDEFCPRFILTKNGVSYENEAMSLGEQLILYTFWVLTKKFNSPGLFFIEEPETGLSPISQKRMLDLLAYISSVKKKQIFVSSHSPFIISAMGKDRAIVMKNNGESEWLNASDNNYIEELGLDIGKEGIVFLEDKKALVFLKKILDIYGSQMRKSLYIYHLQGESDVFEVVDRIKPNDGVFRVFGVLDADQKKFGDKYDASGSEFYYLPGLDAPEIDVINSIKLKTKDYARALVVKHETLNDVIRRLEGVDHHDYFEELSRLLFGEFKANVYESAFMIWFESYQDRGEVRTFVKSIDPRITIEEMDEVDRDFPVTII